MIPITSSNRLKIALELPNLRKYLCTRTVKVWQKNKMIFIDDTTFYDEVIRDMLEMDKNEFDCPRRDDMFDEILVTDVICRGKDNGLLISEKIIHRNGRRSTRGMLIEITFW
jgi:hypothetical protein